jgi:hypothetical protein
MEIGFSPYAQEGRGGDFESAGRPFESDRARFLNISN